MTTLNKLRTLSAIFATLLLTPSGLFSQERPPPAIKYRGVSGIFLTEAQARTLAQDKIKGITYYKNWKISEAQLQDKDLRILNLEEVSQKRLEDLRAEKQVNQISKEAIDQGLKDRNKMTELYKKEKAKNKMIPWIGIGGAVIGSFATYQFMK